MASKDDREDDETIPKTLYDKSDGKLTKLTQEGYSYKFVDKIDDLIDFDIICAFCYMVVRDARQISSCGHSFCRSCWGDWLSGHGAGGKIKCPIDNELIDPSHVFQDRKQDRMIQGLRVYCENHDFGCNVTPELRDVQKHMEKCEFQTVSCSLLCGTKLLLSELRDHMENRCDMRVLECQRCRSRILAKDVDAHEDVCSHKPQDCEFCPAKDIPRSDIPEHHKHQCQNYPTYCSFAVVGCSHKVQRSCLKEHHKDASDKHLHLLNSAVSQLYDVIGIVPRGSESREYELPIPLWDKLPSDESETANSGSVLHECNNEGATGSKTVMTIISELATDKKNSERKINYLLDKVDELTLNFNVLCTKIENNNVRRSTNELIEGAFNVCPCVWKFNPYQMYSPAFYTDDKYCFRFSVSLLTINNCLCYLIEVRSVVGDYDDNLQWPRLANHLLMEVRSGKVGGDAKVYESYYSGFTFRPTEMCDGNVVIGYVVQGTSFILTMNYDCTVNRDIVPLYWKLMAVENAIQAQRGVNDSTDRSSPKFYTDNGYRMRVSVSRPDKKNYCHIMAYIEQGDYDSELQWPVRAEQLVMELNVGNGCEQVDHSRCFYSQPVHQPTNATALRPVMQYTLQTQPQELSVTIKSLSSVMPDVANNVPFTWTLRDVDVNNKTLYTYSPVFCSEDGYRFRFSDVCISPYSSPKSRIEARCVQGPNDDELKWPYLADNVQIMEVRSAYGKLVDESDCYLLGPVSKPTDVYEGNPVVVCIVEGNELDVILKGKAVNIGRNGLPFTWHVHQGCNQTIYSPRFYTDDGYYMHLHATYGNTSTCTTIHASVVKGIYDNKLRWPWSPDQVVMEVQRGINNTSGKPSLVDQVSRSPRVQRPADTDDYAGNVIFSAYLPGTQSHYNSPPSDGYTVTMKKKT